MKLKNVYYSIALIFLVVTAALWKLNATYKAEKTAVKQNQLQTQSTAIRSSLISQISQLRNILSTYTVQVDESKINWIQLKPFYALALVQEEPNSRLTVTKLFLQSGSAAERWSAAVLQQQLNPKVASNQLLRAQTFKDENGLAHLALTVFDREKRNQQPRSGVMVVGDVSYFQRFFDLQRTSSVTQVLLTADKLVTAHSEYEYVGNLSDENKISSDSFFIDRQELRGTNLSLMSYAAKKANSYLDIPLPMLGIIVGLGFLMSGIMLITARPEKSAMVEASFPESKNSEPLVLKVQEPIFKPAPKPAFKPVAKVSVEPLVFDHQPKIIAVQVQACLQQAVFNLDRVFKNNAVVINKDFASSESVVLDYPKFIKIFESILNNIAQAMVDQMKKKIYIRSYDSSQLIILEIQAPIAGLALNDTIMSELKAVACEYSQASSSAGEAVFKFSFTRPVERKATPIKIEIPEPKPVAKPEVIKDLDIDSILSLDDDNSETAILIEKEMRPAKFKLDEKMSIIEDPEIDMTFANDKKIDLTKVKIRRPEKG